MMPHRSTVTSSRSVQRNTRVRILGIPGSLRRESYNKSAVRAAAEVSPEWVNFEVYEHLAEVPLFNADVADVMVPPGVQRLRNALRNTDAVLISTPEYNQAVPGVVKNMIDWLSIGAPGEGLERRPVAITGATTGRWGTRIAQTMLRQMLVSTQALVLPQPFLYLGNAPALFDESGKLVDGETRARLSELVTALAEWALINGAAGTPAADCLQGKAV